ncbi:ADP-ribose pyrophosphatase YjhB, NUDIX family [Candidatus Hydrogenisulfobacillus filiaventi]|uniref:ADP-ribose pyrophosphatase YjhB, NUDIX family n=1 Tax=Candidatus Hydrogenisulfobacillus filiaventi TaxID=2707344 RepID=A0A6F8ZJ32_9FIRM|nr:NUDIX hydrolase [Bacillota bacterium]CAB1129889.1 ADP-ribose pyrophosphatase YjhB, NUDIX family [Candidatus Hydrogenisulfobacillus filiaventi]
MNDQREPEQDERDLPVKWRLSPPAAWRFCPECGHTLTDHEWDGRPRRYCPRCGFVYWQRPTPAAAVIVREDAAPRVLLVRRRYPPEEGGLTFPGGGVEMGESVAEAARREVAEETGLVVSLDAQLGIWSTPSTETLIVFFAGHPVGGELRPGSDALEAFFCPMDAVPRLVFNVHQAAWELYRRAYALL